jgi:phosphotransferase system HPr (HPr) family protein
MSQTTASRTVTVTNATGLHLRAAMLIAKLAKQFQSKVELIREHQRADAQEMLQLVSLGAAAGVELRLEATGADAEQALEALGQLFADNFGE